MYQFKCKGVTERYCLPGELHVLLKWIMLFPLSPWTSFFPPLFFFSSSCAPILGEVIQLIKPAKHFFFPLDWFSAASVSLFSLLCTEVSARAAVTEAVAMGS